jgi:acyl-CoA reductase-like NAD-dependent aldehyde dehydrogenase
VWQPFLDGFVESTLRYRLGDPLDPETSLGPMATAKAATGVREQVLQAQHAGATALIDPQYFPTDRHGSAYLMPQVLTSVDHGMAVMRERRFVKSSAVEIRTTRKRCA